MTDPKKKTAAVTKKKAVAAPWMDVDVAFVAQNRDITEQLALADQLEAKAAQLRGFRSRRVPMKTTVTVRLLPAAEEALKAFSREFGPHWKDCEYLSAAAQCVLEIGLIDLPRIVANMLRLIKYRDAEDLDDSHLCNEWIQRSLERWEELKGTR